MKDRGNFGAEKLVFIRCDVGKSDRVEPKMSGAFLASFGACQKILVRRKGDERNVSPILQKYEISHSKKSP